MLACVPGSKLCIRLAFKGAVLCGQAAAFPQVLPFLKWDAQLQSPEQRLQKEAVRSCCEAGLGVDLEL